MSIGLITTTSPKHLLPRRSRVGVHLYQTSDPKAGDRGLEDPQRPSGERGRQARWASERPIFFLQMFESEEGFRLYLSEPRQAP